MKNLFKYWIPVYLYAAIIFYMSSIPRPVPQIPIPYFDKLLHIIEYFIFGILAARAFKYSPRRIFHENFKISAILLTILYSISDEFHQLFVPLREFSIIDIIADTVGGILSTIIYSAR